MAIYGTPNVAAVRRRPEDFRLTAKIQRFPSKALKVKERKFGKLFMPACYGVVFGPNLAKTP
jgi:hypothetical protein